MKVNLTITINDDDRAVLARHLRGKSRPLASRKDVVSTIESLLEKTISDARGEPRDLDPHDQLMEHASEMQRSVTRSYMTIGYRAVSMYLDDLVISKAPDGWLNPLMGTRQRISPSGVVRTCRTGGYALITRGSGS